MLVEFIGFLFDSSCSFFFPNSIYFQEYIALHKKNRYFANELFDKCFMVSIPKEVADELARLEAERTKAIFG